MATGSSFAVALRLQPTASPGLGILFSLGSEGESFDTNALSLRFENGAIGVLTETDAGVDHLTELGPVPTPDQWHALVFVFDGTQLSLYVDGALASSNAYVPVETGATGLNVGASSGHQVPFVGLLDDLQIYDEPLSAAQAEFLSDLGG